MKVWFNRFLLAQEAVKKFYSFNFEEKMNSITLSEHSCANKCTEFKKTGEQCSHCLIKQQETVSENNQDSQAVLNLVGGIKAALKILNGNPDAFDWYSLEINYYYGTRSKENLISLDQLQQACNQYFVTVFGGIKAIQYIVENAPVGATHFDRYFEKIDFRTKEIFIWVDGAWSQQELRIMGFNKAIADSVALNDLRNTLETMQSPVIATFADSNFTYEQITQSTVERIQYFNLQKEVALEDGNHSEADSFDNQADGAYLLWFHLTKSCQSKFDLDRLQKLVGAR